MTGSWKGFRPVKVATEMNIGTEGVEAIIAVVNLSISPSARRKKAVKMMIKRFS